MASKSRCWESEGPSGTSTPDLAPSIPACLLLQARQGLEDPGNFGHVGSSRLQRDPTVGGVILCYRFYRESSQAIIKQEKDLEPLKRNVGMTQDWQEKKKKNNPPTVAPRLLGPLRSFPSQAARPGRMESLRASEAPAREANHLCHTVTIILHKIIIKNPNFSASNPASGLLAFFSPASAGRDQRLITAAWRPARSQSSAN